MNKQLYDQLSQYQGQWNQSQIQTNQYEQAQNAQWTESTVRHLQKTLDKMQTQNTTLIKSLNEAYSTFTKGQLVALLTSADENTRLLAEAELTKRKRLEVLDKAKTLLSEEELSLLGVKS